MSLLAAQSLFVLGALCVLLIVASVFIFTLIYFYYKHCVNAKTTAAFDLQTDDGLVIQIKHNNK